MLREKKGREMIFFFFKINVKFIQVNCKGNEEIANQLRGGAIYTKFINPNNSLETKSICQQFGQDAYKK
jgi:hypothetical protein